MNIEDSCKYFKSCSAPICPENKDTLSLQIFYPDEPICKLPLYNKKTYIINQHAVYKQVIDRESYFTYKFLNKKRRITNKTKGNSLTYG